MASWLNGRSYIGILLKRIHRKLHAASADEMEIWISNTDDDNLHYSD